MSANTNRAEPALTLLPILI